MFAFRHRPFFRQSALLTCDAAVRLSYVYIELEDNAAWELLMELAEAGGHPNIAKGFAKAKEQEDDHLIKIKTLIRRDLIVQIK